MPVVVVVFWGVRHGDQETTWLDADIRWLDRCRDGWTMVSIKDASGALEMIKKKDLF